MKLQEIITEEVLNEISRRGFLKGIVATGLTLASGLGAKKSQAEDMCSPRELAKAKQDLRDFQQHREKKLRWQRGVATMSLHNTLASARAKEAIANIDSVLAELPAINRKELTTLAQRQQQVCSSYKDEK